ncbi:MAG: macrolide 2-phosphotransferase [Microbacteriaceae bacterium]|jgi:macrolide phosphotransferase|nr:macrolide 2-phosphotransferase [Microbacteriaceae bacterium]HEV7955968.1 phosphotransferase [Marisediminicola sp.]
MARSPLTLAALATSAVAGLDVTAASRFGSGPLGGFEQSVLVARDGQRLLIRVPRRQDAETRASADLVALRALSTGIRGRLPFTVHSLKGQAPIAGTRAIVYDFLPGTSVALGGLRPGDGLAESIGRAIAAIHSLPTSLVADAGLPVVRPLDILATAASVMDRASATGLVPAGLVARWEHATEDAALWQFAPTVINGALRADSLLHDGDSVTGIVDWYGLSVGDPATDLFWLFGGGVNDAAESVVDAYSQARGSTDRQLKKRAMLYAELEIAKWLLHGTAERSTEIVDDAVGMLHNLVDVVQHDLNRRIDSNTSPVMTVTEVEDMLDRTERSS